MKLIELLTSWRARAEELKPFAPAAAETFVRAADDLERAIRSQESEEITTRLRTRAGAVQSRNDCSSCYWRSPLVGADRNHAYVGLENHHVVPRQAGGSDEESNRVVLCSNCHELAHVLWPVESGVYKGPRTSAQLVVELRAACVNYPAWREWQLLQVATVAPRKTTS